MRGRSGEVWTKCIVPGCERKLLAHGMCSMHYQRFTKHGDFELRMTPKRAKAATEEERLQRRRQQFRDWYARRGPPPVTEERRKKHTTYAREHNRKHPEKSRATAKRWAKNNPESLQKYYFKRKYGITLEERDAIFNSQGSRCAICRTDDPGRNGWVVDHCHTTNKVRGILCRHCNHVLGFAKDDTAILNLAIKYLKKGLLL